MGTFEFLKNKYAKVGFWGTLVAAVCCFTPLLVWGLAAAGLAAFTTWLDYILLPALLVFFALFFLDISNTRKTNPYNRRMTDHNTKRRVSINANKQL